MKELLLRKYPIQVEITSFQISQTQSHDENEKLAERKTDKKTDRQTDKKKE